MPVKYSALQQRKIVREAAKSTDICGVLKKYHLSKRCLERMQKEQGNILATVRTAVNSMFLSDGSRNPVIVPRDDDPNFRVMSQSGKMVFKSNLARHKFYMKNIRRFSVLELPCAPWDIPPGEPDEIPPTRYRRNMQA